MLVVNGNEGSLLISSVVKSTYNELKNAKDLGVRYLEVDDNEKGIKLLNESYKNIGFMLGDEYDLIRNIVISTTEITSVINAVKDLNKVANNKIMKSGKFVRSAKNYLDDLR